MERLDGAKLHPGNTMIAYVGSGSIGGQCKPRVCVRQFSQLTLAAAYSCMLCLGKRGKNA